MNFFLPLDQIPRWTRILLPESKDVRIISAAIELQTAGIIEPILLGNPYDMASLLTEKGEFTEGQWQILEQIEIIPFDEIPRNELAKKYSQKRWVSLEQAMDLFPLDLAQAVSLLQEWKVAWVVSGSIATTAEVIRTGYYWLGLAAERRISGEFLMIPSEKSLEQNIYIIGDSAVNPDPTTDELVEIARSLVETHEIFLKGVIPRVAFLSFSTHTSGVWLSVSKSREAVEKFRAKYPDIEVDGPLQFDAAIDRDIYLTKTKGKWWLSGEVNILVFPDLDSGNIGYKMMERFGWYQAIWPILTGFAHPGWSDLSRGTTIETIVYMAYVTAIRGLRK